MGVSSRWILSQLSAGASRGGDTEAVIAAKQGAERRPGACRCGTGAPTAQAVSPWTRRAWAKADQQLGAAQVQAQQTQSATTGVSQLSIQVLATRVPVTFLKSWSPATFRAPAAAGRASIRSIRRFRFENAASGSASPFAHAGCAVEPAPGRDVGDGVAAAGDEVPALERLVQNAVSLREHPGGGRYTRGHLFARP